ncbi:hypothetical protein BH10PSE7_BH10PSE7_15450 [soil metagenome]
MADISITAANVVAGANAVKKAGTIGETVTAGQPGYLDPTTQKWMKADSNSATAAARQAQGIFLNGGAVNQPCVVQTAGDITIGGTLTPGVAYYLSDTAGGICPVADIGSGEYVCLLGIAKSASVLTIDIQFPNVAL